MKNRIEKAPPRDVEIGAHGDPRIPDPYLTAAGTNEEDRTTVTMIRFALKANGSGKFRWIGHRLNYRSETIHPLQDLGSG